MIGNKNSNSYDPEYIDFVNCLLSSKTGIRTSGAIEVGRRAVEYFRGIDFVRWIRKNSIFLKQNYPELLKSYNFEDNNSISDLGTNLILKSFILKAEYKPVSNSNENTKIPKWPKRLAVSQNQDFDEKFYYIVTFESNKTMSNIVMVSIISSVVALCMFPAWPFVMKLTVWYLSVFLLIIMLIILFSRLIVFAICWFFGFDIWILPTLFDEEAGVIDSFKPLYSITKRSDDWFMVVIRIFCAIFFAGAIYQLSQTHTVSDVGEFAKRSLIDVLDWGHKKLASPSDMTPSTLSSDSIARNPNIKLTPEMTCISRCLRFESKSTLLGECCNDCQCITELISLPCLKSRSICPEDLHNELLELKNTTCYLESNGIAEESVFNDEL